MEDDSTLTEVIRINGPQVLLLLPSVILKAFISGTLPRNSNVKKKKTWLLSVQKGEGESSFDSHTISIKTH